MSIIAKNPVHVEPWLATFLSHAHRKHYSKGASIIHDGDQPETLFYIVQGSVSVMIEEEDGREIVLAYLNKGDFFGELGLFDETVRSAWVVAKAECEIAEINYTNFKSLCKDVPEILWSLAAQMGDRLRKTNEKVRDLAFVDVTGRVARTLIELAKEPDAITHPDGMQIRITRQEIAKIVGCSREMAGRVLKELENDGLITAKGKTIVVFGTR